LVSASTSLLSEAFW